MKWQLIVADTDASICTDEGEIAHVTDEMVDWQANARLIAAAPELLDML
ncbi:hypothetical protein LCGC14_2711650, partial [marine sediment metagenome]